MLEQLGERWTGPSWRWWSLGAGVALAGAVWGIGALLDGVRGIDGGPLSGVLLISALLIVSLLGSGMLDSVTSRVRTSGGSGGGSGLQRRTPPGSDPAARMAADDLPARRSRRHPRGRNPALNDAEQERQDRRTIRCGLVALPLFVVLLVMLLG